MKEIGMPRVKTRKRERVEGEDHSAGGKTVGKWCPPECKRHRDVRNGGVKGVVRIRRTEDRGAGHPAYLMGTRPPDESMEHVRDNAGDGERGIALTVYERSR